MTAASKSRSLSTPDIWRGHFDGPRQVKNYLLLWGRLPPQPLSRPGSSIESQHRSRRPLAPTYFVLLSSFAGKMCENYASSTGGCLLINIWAPHTSTTPLQTSRAKSNSVPVKLARKAGLWQGQFHRGEALDQIYSVATVAT